MEDLFKIVQSIELRKYTLSLDKHDIEGIIRFSLKVITLYECGNNEEKIFSAVLVQILQKISRKVKNTLAQRRRVRLNLTPAEYYTIKELIDIADFNDMPLLHSILIQLDQ